MVKPNQSVVNKFVSLAGVISSIYLAIILVQTVRNNASLQGQIGQLQRDVSQLKEDNAELGYQIEYYKTDAYKEKAARAKLGLQKPGETLVILPRDKISATQTPAEAAKTKTSKTANWVQWWHFLFG